MNYPYTNALIKVLEQEIEFLQEKYWKFNYRGVIWRYKKRENVNIFYTNAKNINLKKLPDIQRELNSNVTEVLYDKVLQELQFRIKNQLVFEAGKFVNILDLIKKKYPNINKLERYLYFFARKEFGIDKDTSQKILEQYFLVNKDKVIKFFIKTLAEEGVLINEYLNRNFTVIKKYKTELEYLTETLILNINEILFI